MAKRPMYHVILKDLCQDDRTLWTKNIRVEIKRYMTDWFSQICAASTDFSAASAECWWSSNRLLVEKDELVVYFLPTRSHSLIAHRGAALPVESHGGGTMLIGTSIVSEVYIWENTRQGMQDPRHSRLLALVALHELIHNKLDADPNNPGQLIQQVGNKETKTDITDMHAQLDGIARGRLSGNSQVTPHNMKVMADNLSLENEQYTGHLFSHVGDRRLPR